MGTRPSGRSHPREARARYGGRRSHPAAAIWTQRPPPPPLPPPPLPPPCAPAPGPAPARRRAARLGRVRVGVG
eukprot:scaffold35583_cov31-Phaeocystis_antarctica.AAC.1